MQDAVAMIFLFAVGACVGSFLNVVVWRLPRGESLVSPGSHCPKCNTPLKAYDNLPILGWLKLRGKCRHCGQPISARYPIVEAGTALLFVGIYAMLFIAQLGPAVPETPDNHVFELQTAYANVANNPRAEPFTVMAAPTSRVRPLGIDRDWPLLVLYLAVASTLLAASLIDAELYLIPLSLCYFMAIVGVVAHTSMDNPSRPGSVAATPIAAAMALGSGAGLLISLVLLKLKLMPLSFPNGEVLEVDRAFIQQDIDAAIARGDTPPEMPPLLSSGQVRIEIGKEMLFLLPPLALGLTAAILVAAVPSARQHVDDALVFYPVGGFLGSLLGALVGAFVVWIVRIFGSLGFGRIAMGLGDVHLMFGVGAALGGGRATVAFFIAPFFGLVYALYSWLSGKGREVPYGPYLSLASVAMMFFYGPVADYLRPGLMTLREMVAGMF